MKTILECSSTPTPTPTTTTTTTPNQTTTPAPITTPTTTPITIAVTEIEGKGWVHAKINEISEYLFILS